MTAVAMQQPAMGPRPVVSIAPARPRTIHKSPPGKETLNKPTPNNGSVSNIRSRRERPCDACRRRKSRCVIHEGAALCVLCEFHKQECTFVQSPLPRKRKVVDGEKKDSPSNTKKRYVQAFKTASRTRPCHVLTCYPLPCHSPPPLPPGTATRFMHPPLHTASCR